MSAETPLQSRERARHAAARRTSIAFICGPDLQTRVQSRPPGTGSLPGAAGFALDRSGLAGLLPAHA